MVAPIGELSTVARVLSSVWFLYVGPDQLLPLTSALGAILGIVLMLWRRLVGVWARVWQAIRSGLPKAPDIREVK